MKFQLKLNLQKKTFEKIQETNASKANIIKSMQHSKCITWKNASIFFTGYSYEGSQIH